MTPKKLHRFLIDTLGTDSLWDITDEHVVYQIVTVLKFTVGESFIVFSDRGPDVTVEILERSKSSVQVKTIATTQTRTLPRTIIAAVSLTKGSSFELAVQKLTEVGVSAIIPILSERTVKQSVRLERLQKISNEALEQSGGNTVVTLYPPMTLTESIKAFHFPIVVLDAYTTQRDTPIEDTLIMYVGPEGGWSSADKQIFETQKVTTLSLGSKILRTETAAIIGAHTLLFS